MSAWLAASVSTVSTVAPPPRTMYSCASVYPVNTPPKKVQGTDDPMSRDAGEVRSDQGVTP